MTSTDISGDSADVLNGTYDVPGTGGVHVTRGTSVDALVAQAGLSESDVTFVEVDTTDGYGRHLITAADQDGGGSPPVFYSESGALDRMRYVRDGRGGNDDQRQSGPDQGLFLSDQDSALEVVVHTTGHILDPTATASPVDGSNRSYSLTCSGCAGLSTTWYFPDGTTNSDTNPTFTFPARSVAGSYLVAVAVEDPSDGSFGWGQVTVRAGPAPSASASPTASAGTGGNGGGHTGSNHGGSGHSANPHPGHGHGGSTTASPSTSASSGPTAVATLPPVLPSAEPSSSLYVPSTDGPLGPPSSSAAIPTPALTPTTTPTPSVSPTGPVVSGVLLADDQPVVNAHAGQILDETAPTSAAAPDLDPSLRVDPLVWLALGVALLLGVGAASESARVRDVLRRATRRVLRRTLRRWVRIGG